MNDIKEISPWDLIEGVRTSSTLSLSFYGAARVERKPLKYEEQFQLVQMHSHKRQLPMHNFVYIADQKDLPSTNPPAADGVNVTPKQEGELGGTEAINNPSVEQATSQDQVKKPQNNASMAMPHQQRDHMIQQQIRAQQMPAHMAGTAAAGMTSQLHHSASAVQAAAAAAAAAGGGGSMIVRHQMAQPQGYNPRAGMMGPGSAYQQMQKPSTFPPPYQPQPRQPEMLSWNNAGQPGVGAYDKRREQLKAIQTAAIYEARRQQMLTPMQQGRGYGTGMAGQQLPPRGIGGIQAGGVMRNHQNMQDYLNQFPADQRNLVYQQLLRKRQQQQMQATQQQHQPHPGMPMGGAVRGTFVRQAPGYPNQMSAIRHRVGGMIQGYGGLQQQQQAAARQQQLFQIQQQQQQQFQQQQFGGGAGYNQF